MDTRSIHNFSHGDGMVLMSKYAKIVIHNLFYSSLIISRFQAQHYCMLCSMDSSLFWDAFFRIVAFVVCRRRHSSFEWKFCFHYVHVYVIHALFSQNVRPYYNCCERNNTATNRTNNKITANLFSLVRSFELLLRCSRYFIPSKLQSEKKNNEEKAVTTHIV